MKNLLTQTFFISAKCADHHVEYKKVSASGELYQKTPNVGSVYILEAWRLSAVCYPFPINPIDILDSGKI